MLSFWVGILLLARGLVLLPILTKNIALPAYGLWAQITAALALVLPIASLGLDNAVMRMWPSQSDRRIAATAFFSVVALVAALSAAVALVGLGLSGPLGDLTADPQGASLVRLASLTILVSSVERFVLLYFRAHRQVALYSGLQVADAYISTVATAVMVLGGLGLIGAITGPLIVQGSLAVFGLALVVRQIGLARPQVGTLRPYVSFALPLLPTGIFLWVLNASDRFILGALNGLPAVGVYSVGYQLSYYTTLFFNPIFLILIPRTAELWDAGRHDEALAVIERATRAGSLLTIPAIVGLTALGPALLRLITTPEYVPGASVIPLVGLGYLLLMLSGMNETVLNLRLENRPLVIVYLTAAALNVGLTVVLVLAFGLVGAGIATFATFAALVAMTTALARRGPMFRVDVAAIVKQSFAAAAMGLVLWIVAPSSVLDLVLAIPLGATCYVGLLFVLRGFDARHLREIRSAMFST